MRYTHYDVDSLGDFYELLEELRIGFWQESCSACPTEDKAGCMDNGGFYERACRQSPPMWFRGHEEQDWSLLPTLLRKIQNSAYSVHFQQDYTSTAIWGDYREQGFRARTYHRMQTIPETNYDWTAVLQHHRTSTTMLDWTESAESALLFALEPFIDCDRGKSLDICARKARCTPVIWVLNPTVLNACAYDKLCQPEPLAKALDAYASKLMTVSELERFLQDKQCYFSTALCEYPNINGMISLSVLNAKRLEQDSALFNRVIGKEFNPFFWLLLRYYCDGVAAETDWGIPGVGTIQPYHSKRIQGQRGVFTAFPNYQFKTKAQISDFAMERHSDAPRYLIKIHLNYPDRLAAQLMQSGATLSGLYQDLDHFSYELEQGP